MRINATDFQNAFGKYLALADKEDIVITKNGKNVAKLVSYTEPEHYFVHEESNDYIKSRKITYEEYLELVNLSNQRYELIDGEIYLLTSPSFRHQVIVNEISWHFNNFFRKNPCRSLTSPLDIRLFGHAAKFEENPNVVQPDIVVICDENKVREDNKYEGTPTLVVEVLSPSTKAKDMAVKLNLYMRSGILEYWIVDLDKKCILQYLFNEKRSIEELNYFNLDEKIQSVAFPEMSIPLRDIFVD